MKKRADAVGMEVKLEARAEALKWAMSKDGGQRLEGFYNRTQAATLYHDIIDTAHDLALVYEWMRQTLDHETWLVWTGGK